MLQSANL